MTSATHSTSVSRYEVARVHLRLLLIVPKAKMGSNHILPCLMSEVQEWDKSVKT